MNELALFTGAGGGILGGHLLGWTTRCAVEIDPYCRSVLLARQRDGTLPPFPIWDDSETFDGRPWRGSIDVVSGGFPCQDISSAGKRAGMSGGRSGPRWRDFARIIGEVEPTHVFIENSDQLRTQGLDEVLRDLADLGYDARWGVVSGAHVGAPHRRNRMWIVGHANGFNGEAAPLGVQQDGPLPIWGGNREEHASRFFDLRETYPGTVRVADGVAHWVDRLKSIGNGQIPSVAALAWTVLSAGFE